MKVQLALFPPNLCWKDHPWVASRYYSSHFQVVLEPLDVTCGQSSILFLHVCGHRRTEPSPSDLFHASFMYKIPELRLIWTNVRELRSFFWKVPSAKCFLAFSWLEILYNSNYSSLVCIWIVAFALVTRGAVEMAVACHGLCARQGWPLLASRFKCSSVSQCLGAEELCFSLVLGKGPETCGSQARHRWELLWMLCCGCPGCWRHLGVLSPLQRVSSPHVWGNLLQLFSQPTL